MAAMARKLYVEVVEARDLLPKDGTGTSSPYVVADFDGQRRRTQTICRNLNPTWNELLQFNVSCSANITGAPLEVDVFHDQRVGPSRRNNFLGRVRLDFRQFVRKGEEALIHFPLEKKSFFSWVRGDIGLRIYYDDVSVASSTAKKEGNPTGEAEVPPTDDDATAEKSPEAEKADETKAPPEKQTNCVNLPEQETEPPSNEAEKKAPASPPPPAPVEADESVAEAWKADEASTSRSKIYLSPKLWYLRVTLIEAQEISTPTREISLFIRATLGFQVLKTRAAFPRNGAPAWNEDLLFVTAEPFSEEESLLVLYLESRQGKEVAILGSAAIPLSSVERRVDDRKVASRWLDLPSVATQARLQVRLCLDGGYHVQDEQTHANSDNRPSARQLWRPALGTIDIGVIGCRGLLPMKAVDGKGTTDAFAVAKYGPKWARTRTVADSFDPAWNEQFNWPVFDTATVLTIVVFDDVNVTGGSKESAASCRPLGRIRIRISTLETNRSYRCFYPLHLLLPSGLKRIGEIEIAMRFTRTLSQFDLLHVYTLPILPAMHHIRPIGYPQRESLRIAAARVSAAHLGRMTWGCGGAGGEGSGAAIVEGSTGHGGFCRGMLCVGGGDVCDAGENGGGGGRVLFYAASSFPGTNAAAAGD